MKWKSCPSGSSEPRFSATVARMTVVSETPANSARADLVQTSVICRGRADVWQAPTFSRSRKPGLGLESAIYAGSRIRRKCGVEQIWAETSCSISYGLSQPSSRPWHFSHGHGLFHAISCGFWWHSCDTRCGGWRWVIAVDAMIARKGQQDGRSHCDNYLPAVAHGRMYS